ncbi:MAG: hypothetical protein ACR2QA_13290 [Solirubrobacteraceae bacterium]
MSREDLKQAIFGSFDGLTSALGVITGLIVAGVHTGPRILAAALVIGHYRGYRLTLSILTVVIALTVALTVAVG